MSDSEQPEPDIRLRNSPPPVPAPPASSPLLSVPATSSQSAAAGSDAVPDHSGEYALRPSATSEGFSDAEEVADSDGTEEEDDDAAEWQDAAVSDVPVSVGPGLLKSFLWMFGMLCANIAGSLIVLLGLFVQHVLIAEPLRDAGHAMQLAREFLVHDLQNHLLTLLAGGQLATLVYAAIGIRFEFRRLPNIQLFRSPTLIHVVLIVLAALPLSLIGSSLQHAVLHQMPDSKSEMVEMFGELKQSSLFSLLLVLALLPALAEELLFRGIIGRGLVNRYGTVIGVLTTSLLFGIVHLNPGQAVGVLPIGIAMHAVYLMTRTLWLPMLLHFLNNSLAVLMLKYGEHWLTQDQLSPDGWSSSLLTSAGALLLGISLMFWQTRYQSRLSDGTDFDAELLPDADLPARLKLSSGWAAPEGIVVAGVILNLCGFLAVLFHLN